MTNKQKVFPSLLSKAWHAEMRPEVRFAVRTLLLVIHYGISLGWVR